MNTAKKPKVEPQKCPRCKADSVVEKRGTRAWRVVCSKNTRPLGSHWVVGHEMFTRGDAIRVWNELDETAGSDRA